MTVGAPHDAVPRRSHWPARLRRVAASVHGAVDPSALRAEGFDPAAIVDFSSNQSPLGAAPAVAAAVAAAVVDAYPDPHAAELTAALAVRHGVDPGARRVRQRQHRADPAGRAAGAAAGRRRPRALARCSASVRSRRRSPGARLERVPLAHGEDGAGFFCDEPALRKALGEQSPRLCWLCSPNNPTGAALPAALAAALAADHPATLFVLDEAYCDLLPEPQWSRAQLPPNLVVLRSMTKYWGLAGLRLGYAIAAPAEAAALRAAVPPWSVNACAQAAGLAALADREHHDRAVALLVAERDRLVAGLRSLGWVTEPTTAGFFLIRAGDAAAVRGALLARGCLVRDCTSFGLPSHIRVSPRHPEQNDLLLEAFSSLTPPGRVRRGPAMTGARGRVIMLQGTASHAGKTVLAAALCRIYARRGLRVAPFKAQNMALNSFVTEDGGEMGRAQAYQARAAGLEPHVDMNPVLLKPSSDATSQVVVMGRPVGHMTVREYQAYQAEVWPTVTSAFERLRTSHDLVVLEGAGSSAEVNLRGRDIVNMRMALHARSPVLLVGDIDRGGVFASLLGHVELFTPEERGLVAGFVINKMRGDASQLDSGIEILAERTGVPTLGVVPMLEGWSGDEEDSVALDDGHRREKPGAPLRIAVVRLPYLSNSTDTDALAAEPDVDVRFVSSPDELAGAAAIVLPGTKSTIADLAWLRERGLDRRGQGGRRRRDAGRRHLRRLPDARPPHPRSRARRVRRPRRRRPGPAGRGDDLRRRQADRPRGG